MSLSPLAKITIVWCVLLGMTLASWGLGMRDIALVRDAVPASTLIIAIAFFKVRLIITHFMDVRHAPFKLRLACDAWIIGLLAGLLYLGI